MFTNKASKIYQRLDNVLKKDKNVASSFFVSENAKQDIEKALKTYLEIKPATSKINIATKNDEMFLSYTVSVKRIKEFIYY